MTLKNWVDRSRMQIKAYGPHRGMLATSRSLWSGIAHRLSALRAGTRQNVYDLEWDVLVVLDTCRVDALQQVAHEYDYLPAEIPAIRSVGPDSHTWIERTFASDRRNQIAETAYLSGNPHTDKFVEGTYPVGREDFYYLENVFETAFDEEYGTVPPRVITGRAVSYLRANSPRRTILHYMQPHTPYRGLDLDGIGQAGPKGYRETVWDHIQAGLLSREEAWDYYIDNLRWVLDDLELLFDNIDAETVAITADHGECFGEFGAYAHSAFGEFEVLRRVPWVKISAEDTGAYDPMSRETAKVTETTISVEEQLEHLGYM